MALSKTARGWLIGFGIVVLIVSISLFAAAFAVLPVNNRGLDFNKTRKKLNKDKEYGPGRYFLGLGHEFITFPSTLQTIEFSSDGQSDAPRLDSFARGGQQIFVEASFQYQIRPGSLVKIYDAFQLQYHQAFVRIAQATLKDTSTVFTVENYFESRRNISAGMTTALESALGVYFVDVKFFQLRHIGLPSQFETSLINKVVTAQNKTKQALVQDLTKSQLEVRSVIEQAKQEVTTVESQAAATAFETLQSAEGEGLAKVLKAEQEGFKTLRDGLGLNNQQLLNYMALRILESKTGEKNTYVVGFDGKPTVLNLN